MGWLNEVVLALADGAELNGNAAATLRRIADAVKKVDEIRDASGQAALAAANASLDRLQARGLPRAAAGTPVRNGHMMPRGAANELARTQRHQREAEPGPVRKRSLNARERLSTFRADA